MTYHNGTSSNPIVRIPDSALLGQEDPLASARLEFDSLILNSKEEIINMIRTILSSEASAKVREFRIKQVKTKYEYARQKHKDKWYSTISEYPIVYGRVSAFVSQPFTSQFSRAMQEDPRTSSTWWRMLLEYDPSVVGYGMLPDDQKLVKQALTSMYGELRPHIDDLYQLQTERWTAQGLSDLNQKQLTSLKDTLREQIREYNALLGLDVSFDTILAEAEAAAVPVSVEAVSTGDASVITGVKASKAPMGLIAAGIAAAALFFGGKK